MSPEATLFTHRDGKKWEEAPPLASQCTLTTVTEPEIVQVFKDYVVMYFQVLFTVVKAGHPTQLRIA